MSLFLNFKRAQSIKSVIGLRNMEIQEVTTSFHQMGRIPVRTRLENYPYRISIHPLEIPKLINRRSSVYLSPAYNATTLNVVDQLEQKVGFLY